MANGYNTPMFVNTLMLVVSSAPDSVHSLVPLLIPIIAILSCFGVKALRIMRETPHLRAQKPKTGPIFAGWRRCSNRWKPA